MQPMLLGVVFVAVAELVPLTSSTCTEEGIDPFVTGEKLPCCDGLSEVVADWGMDNNYFFICTAGGRTPPAPKGGEAMAKWMNLQYKGFSADDDASPLGVTIHMQSRFELFCNETGASCWNGNADCRFSASLYNHRMMLDRKSNGIKITMKRNTGIVVDQALTQSNFGKCSYMWDGASFNRYNGACGCVSKSKNCDDPTSAYQNVCPSTGKTCQVEDKEVVKCSCDTAKVPDTPHKGQCFFKGAGLDSDNVQSTVDQTREMVKNRMLRQDESDGSTDPLEYWNEIVMDGRLLLEEIRKDARRAIPAFLYIKGKSSALKTAKRMRDDFMRQYSVSTEIPLISVDPNVDVAKVDGPFSFESHLVHSTSIENQLVNATSELIV